MRVEEFAAEKAWWGGVDRSNRLENEFAWKVSAADIKARNYNLDIKNPHSPDAVVHDPDTLLADYAALQVKIGATRAKLKAVLSAALQGEH
jgi:type I restriction enzyme M protein